MMDLDPYYPVFNGKAEITGCPFILLCGHAANEHLYGAELSFLDVISAYVSCDVNIVVTLPSSANSEYIAAIIRNVHSIHIIPCQLWTERKTTNAQVIDRYQNLLRKFNVQCVHVNSITLREPIIAAKALGIVSLLHVRESLKHDTELCSLIGLKPNDITTLVQKSSDYIIANSSFTAKAYEGNDAVVVIPNVTDTQKLDIDNSISNEITNIALISSNIPKKGVQDFIDIARTLQNTVPSAQFLLIGPQNEYINTLIRKENFMPENLTILGYISSPVEAIRLANIVVNLSNFEESFGRTILEAMAAKRAVVAYDHGALSELIDHGIDGYLVPPADKQAVAEALMHLCLHPCLIHSMGIAGRKKTIDRFSLDNMTLKFKELYKNIGIDI